MIVNTESLAETLDAVNDAFFRQRRLTAANRKELAGWIAQRRGRPGAYAGMFAPTDEDLHNGVRVYTGEPVTSGAAIGHILGEEACRALILLSVEDNTIRDALERATGGMLRRLRQTENVSKVHGMYCCGICTVAMAFAEEIEVRKAIFRERDLNRAEQRLQEFFVV